MDQQRMVQIEQDILDSRAELKVRQLDLERVVAAEDDTTVTMVPITAVQGGGGVDAMPANGRSASIELTLPPLATLWLKPVREE